MIKQSNNGLTYYKFKNLDQFGINHGVFTRKGGVSPTPFSSLNLGSTTGDDNIHVAENRKRIFDVMNLPVTSIFDVWQVHGNEIITATGPRSLNEPHKKADGIITNLKGITLFMRFADCVPILLFAPSKHVIGLVHAGWQGTVKRVVQSAINKMETEFEVNPSSIVAGIGPSICADHYQVGENVIDEVNKNLPEFTSDILIRRDKADFLDLWQANSLLLQQSGVENIELSNFCSFDNTSEWYSHRAEGFHSGRFGVLITLDGYGNENQNTL